MEKIKMFLKKPIALALGGLLLGIFVGLIVLGWGLWPLEWVDALPGQMRNDYQRDYLCMTIDSYIRNQDDALLQLRWNGLGENASAVLDTLTPAVCSFETTDEIEAFKEVIGFIPPADAGLEDETAAEENPLALDQGSDLGSLEPESTFSIVPLAIFLVLTLVVGGVFVVLMKKRKSGESSTAKRAGAVKRSGKIKIQDIVKQKEAAPVAAPAAGKKEPALAQFMTTYRQGDDLYDDSFSIDSVNGEFLGECGVGIAETIGVGDPKKVTALEVWLFDKNDIQTVTKILMSEHASNDSAIRQRLLSKGEPFKAEPGMTFVMETATLQMEAKIVDMVYARGPLPENSYFSRLTLEISVWSK